jgi:hypothetical protein
MVQKSSLNPVLLKTPVLFLVFNRPDTTKKVFESIRMVKPVKLYIAADGARVTKDGETDKVNAVRSLILNNIDWPCDVFTFFRDENLGCKIAVSEAIDWFFKNEEMGIILEDDILPDLSFFRYCEELLIKYRFNQEIKMISGNSFTTGEINGSNSYYFSHYSNIWGWASWRRAWSKYSPELRNWPNRRKTDFLLEIGDFNKDFVRYWRKMLDKTHSGRINTWDYQWQYTIWESKGLCITPSLNLITNLGFGMEGTHTTSPKIAFYKLHAQTLNFPLSHPDGFERNKIADRWHDLHVLDTNPSLLRRIRFHTKKILSQFKTKS